MDNNYDELNNVSLCHLDFGVHFDLSQYVACGQGASLLGDENGETHLGHLGQLFSSCVPLQHEVTNISDLL